MRRYGEVVEVVDTRDLKSREVNSVLVRVRVPFSVPATIKYGARAIIPTKTVLGI